MNKIATIIIHVLSAASASFATDTQSSRGDCYGQFHFTDRQSQEFCKPNISEQECINLVEHYEERFKAKYSSFYHANFILNATSSRQGCAFKKSFPQ